MAIYASDAGADGTRGPFELCPAGAQRAVCCDIIEHGMVPSKFQGKAEKLVHKITIAWQSERKMRDGKPYLVKRRFTCSLHERAALRKYLEAWRGKAFKADEAKKFDLEKLLGVNCQILVEHQNKGARGDFAEVMAIFPPAAGATPLTVAHYIRVQDRKPGDAEPAGPGEYDDSDAPPDQPVPDAPF